MTTAIKFLIDDERVTFLKDKEISVAERQSQPWLYESLKESLPTTGEALAFNPKEFLIDAFEKRKDMFGIANRIKAIEKAGMPTEPYIAFISRLNEDLLTGTQNSIDTIETLIKKVGTVEAPLTWNGDLVLYQRSAWTDSKTYWANDNEFKPFNELTGNLVAGEFSYAMNVCPDTGCAFEVVVQPQHIQKMSSRSTGLWHVSKVMQLAKLGREMTTMQRSESPIVRYENKCIGDETIAMRLPYNPITAATVAEFMLRHNQQLKLVNAPVVQAVSC